MHNQTDNAAQTETTLEEIYASGRVLNLATHVDENVDAMRHEQAAFEAALVRRSFYENVTPSSSAEPPIEIEKETQSKGTMTALSNAAVRLRDAKGSVDDGGRSSSGNWSASSSTHESDSAKDAKDAKTQTPAASQHARNNILSRFSHELNLSAISRTSSQRSIGSCKDSLLSDSVIVHHPDTDCSHATGGYASDTSSAIGSSASTPTVSNRQPADSTGGAVVKRTSCNRAVAYANRDSGKNTLINFADS